MKDLLLESLETQLNAHKETDEALLPQLENQLARLQDLRKDFELYAEEDARIGKKYDVCFLSNLGSYCANLESVTTATRARIKEATEWRKALLGEK